jgi:DNA-binding response OmpR family regulator
MAALSSLPAATGRASHEESRRLRARRRRSGPGHFHHRGAVAHAVNLVRLTSARAAGGGGELLPRSSSAGVSDKRLILVVEDDDATRSFLLDNLVADGFRVAGASSPQEGVRAIEVRQPSLVVLDLAFANGSGLDLLDRLRSADGLASRLDPDLPVIVLTGRSGEADRVRSFARGADDHLNKPFLYAELLARIRAVLRRAGGRRRRGVLRVGELTVDPLTRTVRLGGRRVELSAKEFALLHALAEEPARVYKKQELLRDVWGFLAAGNTRTLDAHACRLRKKLRPSPRPWVVNVRGVGYKLTEAV